MRRNAVNWAEGFRRLSFVFLVPIILIVVIATVWQLIGELVLVFGWIVDNIALVLKAAGAIIAACIVARWVALGFQKPKT